MSELPQNDVYSSDVLVIGSGIAGLYYALRVAEHATVALVTKKQAADSATNWAQGGIAAVLSPDDSIESHVQDTLVAGAGLCNEAVVRHVVGRGPDMIDALLKFGTEFDAVPQPPGETVRFDLGREGGHRHRRILHHRDTTGQEIETALLNRARAHPNISIHEDHCGVDILTRARLGASGPDAALGAYVLDSHSGRVLRFLARVTLLATGGAGKVYLYTSNPDIASGDGMAMAYRAGATLSNMEFVQFHPTCLYHPQAKSFLITEAVRGEGGTLRRRSGRAFMERYHELGDLAPRDVVARAIDTELKHSGDDWVALDITHRDASYVEERFPHIVARCRSFGIDPTREPIPVVPAAHYCCGGVRTDLSGETDLPNLFAAGEVASTGLHGANRLASNSLLESMVFADGAAHATIARLRDGVSPPERTRPWEEGDATESHEAVVITQNWDEIRRFMWNYVGIVRSDKRLARARRRIELLREEISEYYWNFKLTPGLVELRNLATVARLVIRCAEQRGESRGLHYTVDHPERDDVRHLRDTLVRRNISKSAGGGV
ncbi:MAG: L-aspartate oxidase [Myxococcota bacterium]|nr:L-aspartate oxidase [Myxococcota bacterium]MDP6243453.1 L-aspartate oxidase [Myxococcota bacterium]MDP7073652.1 L-aspartate oxidase [Myxococcota bacterium]MDP7298182.1 L-aspartate oxidase [Myxococcota bacterium]MDP7433703.1 L-aspartate oxidase [Myxococcota bacterium]